MPRENYQRRLDALRRDVVGMGHLVLERYDMAIEAAETGDAALAETVVETDHEVNERYLALEQDCTDLIALQQPVAGDLRLITASFKIITDLERVADLATNLAGYGSPMAGSPNAGSPQRNGSNVGSPNGNSPNAGSPNGNSPNAGSPQGSGPVADGSEVGGVHAAVDLRGLSDEARGMVADAMAAYEAADTDACRKIAERDDTLDARCKETSEAVVRDLLAAERDRVETTHPADAELEGTLDDVSRSLLTVRDLERVGDHAVNIAARTLYMIENDDELIY